MILMLTFKQKYEEHVQRALAQGFTPMTEEQFLATIVKINKLEHS